MDSRKKKKKNNETKGLLELEEDEGKKNSPPISDALDYADNGYIAVLSRCRLIETEKRNETRNFGKLQLRGNGNELIRDRGDRKEIKRKNRSLDAGCSRDPDGTSRVSSPMRPLDLNRSWARPLIGT